MTESEHTDILISYSDRETAESMASMLRKFGHACTVESDFGRSMAGVRAGKFDIVVVGMDFGGEDRGLEILNAARSVRSAVWVIVIANRDEVSLAVNAMYRGAANFMQTPVNHSELAKMVEWASELVALQRDKVALQKQVEEKYGLENIVGSSRPMLQVFHRIRQAAATDATVLIQGETGTGKEMVARAIHYNGPRKNNRFVPLNCAGLVETILESELFGHEKGAFTGATSCRIGMFEHANNGTLFLDEIGDMPGSSQVKLLRVLENNEIVRVGSNEPVNIDVRVIAATHQDLHSKVEDSSFRKDLFYRLNVVSIKLPPLRDRREDILLLMHHFLRELTERYGKKIHGVSHEVKKILYRYEWPGNVRELKNCLEHMIVLSNGPVLTEEVMPDYLSQEMDTPGENTMDAMTGQPLDDVEKIHIARTLDLVNGNREKAADLLGIGERTLYRKIRKYELD